MAKDQPTVTPPLFGLILGPNTSLSPRDIKQLLTCMVKSVDVERSCFFLTSRKHFQIFQSSVPAPRLFASDAFQKEFVRWVSEHQATYTLSMVACDCSLVKRDLPKPTLFLSQQDIPPSNLSTRFTVEHMLRIPESFEGPNGPMVILDPQWDAAIVSTGGDGLQFYGESDLLIFSSLSLKPKLPLTGDPAIEIPAGYTAVLGYRPPRISLFRWGDELPPANLKSESNRSLAFHDIKIHPTGLVDSILRLLRWPSPKPENSLT